MKKLFITFGILAIAFGLYHFRDVFAYPVINPPVTTIENSAPSFFAPLLNSLDLANGVGIPTFTRNSIATVTGYAPTANLADGQTIMTVIANEPRFEGARRISAGVYSTNFADGTPIPDATLHGYVAEGARTNLLLYSQKYDVANWIKTYSTVTADSAVSPSGNLDAFKYTPDNANTGANMVSGNYSSAGANTFSVYVKSAGHDKVVLYYIGILAYNVFSFTTKTFIATSVTGWSVQDVGNGWFRLTWSNYDAGDDWYRVNITSASASDTITNYQNTPVGDGTSGIYIWGQQLEAGAFASSYIPTTTGAVTRNADALTYPTAGNFSDTAGSASVQSIASSWSNLSGGYIGDGVEYPLATSTTASGVKAYDGTNTANGPTGTPSGQMKLASKWSGSAMTAYANGTAGTAGTYDGVFNLSSIGIGTSYFGTIRNVRLWKKALTDTQLTNMTSTNAQTSMGAIKKTIIKRTGVATTTIKKSL